MSVLLRYDPNTMKKSVLDSLLDMKSIDFDLRDTSRPSKDSIQQHKIDGTNFFLTSVLSSSSEVNDDEKPSIQNDEKWSRDVNILKEFVQHILVYVVGKKHYPQIGTISNWSTVSDEALALLILENCEEKWNEEKASGTINFNEVTNSSKRKRGNYYVIFHYITNLCSYRLYESNIVFDSIYYT